MLYTAQKCFENALDSRGVGFPPVSTTQVTRQKIGGVKSLRGPVISHHIINIFTYETNQCNPGTRTTDYFLHRGLRPSEIFWGKIS